MSLLIIYTARYFLKSDRAGVDKFCNNEVCNVYEGISHGLPELSVVVYIGDIFDNSWFVLMLIDSVTIE